MTPVDPLELLGVLTGVVAVWLTVRQNVWCWPVGLVNVALFAVVFARARLYADAGLQGVYFALCLYGWWAWLHGGRDRGPLAVTRSPRRERLALAVLAVAGAALLGTLLHRGTNASFPYLDSALTAGSLAAQWLQARKRLENWLVWIAVDVVYVGMYVAKELHLTALLYAGFTALAVAGLREWRRSLAGSAA
ncbi:MAG: nicotinamide riboside transporter PnuC [Thermoanaerobaculia bacterium]|nr:nicotinamide riboside transporter PnuC [Thermoanaerobaculia bacterium]MCZ7649722.1 nicotinamide riboside transporter PnuC [Thermoanaerobaculia bacterium]